MVSSSRLDSKIRSVGQHDLDLGNFRLNFGAWGWIVFYIFALLGVLFPLLLRFVLLRDRFLAPDQSRHRVLISEDVLEIGRAPGTVRKRALFQRGYRTTHVGRFMYYSMQTLLYYMVLVMILANAGRYIKRTHMRGYLYDFWGLAGEAGAEREREERAKAGEGRAVDLDLDNNEEEGNRTPLDAEVEYNFHLVFILVWLFLFGGILLFLSYKAELYNWCMKEVALEDAEFVAMEEQIREVPLGEEEPFGNAAQTRGRTKKEAQTEAVEEALPVARLSGTANDATSETFSAVAPVIEPRQRSSVISQLSDGSRTTTATVATTTTTSAGGSSPSTETRSIIEASILTFATEDADDEDDDDNAESRDSASGAGRGSRRTSTSRIKGKVPRKEPTLVILEDGADVDEFLAENADELDDEGKIELAARLRARAKQTRTSSHQQFLRDLRRRVQTSVRSSVKNSQASTRAGAVEQLPGPRGGPSSPESSNARRNIRFDLNPIVEQVNVSDTDSEAATDLEDAQPPSGRHAPGTRLVSSSSTRNSDGERRHRTGILVGVKVLENCYVENTAHGRFLLFQCQKLQYASGDADHNPTASGAFIPPRNEILEAPLSTLLAKRDDPMTAHQIERDRTFRGLNSIEIALPSLLQWLAAELILVMNLWQIFRNVAVGYHDGVAFVAIPVFLFLLQVFLIARAKQTALQQIEEAADIAQISLRVYRAGESEPQMQLEDLRSQLQASKAKVGGLSEVERRESSGGAEEVVGASTQDEQSINKSNQAQVQVAAAGRDTHEPRWMVVNSCQLVPGDVFEVPDNCAMPCDAVLLDGYALINEADLTGEPMPVSKFPIEVEMGKGKDGKLDLAKHGKKNYLYCGTKVLQSVGATSSSTKRATKVRQTLERSNSKGAKSGAAARSNSKNLVHLEDEEAGDGDVEDEEADQSGNAAFQAIGLVVNTGPATTKGEMIRRILYPTPVRYAFIEQLPWFLFVSVLVFATCFSIPAALTSNRPALQFVAGMFFETVRMATLIIAPQLFLGLLMCQTNAKNRLFLSPARVKTLEPERLLMAGEVKVQCLDKTGTITEDGLQLSGTMPVVKVDGEVQLGELNLFNVGGSEPSGRAEQMMNADTFLRDVGASGPLFSNILSAGEVAPSSTIRPSAAEAQQEGDSPSVVEDSGEQQLFDKNDLFAVAMATCHTVTKGTGSMKGELYGNMVEAEMVRKILSRGMDFRANVGENTVDYYKYTGRAADVDPAAGTRAKSSLPGGNYDAPEENPATAPRSSAAETEVNFDEPGEEERLDELHEDSFYLRRYLLDGEGGGPHDAEGREVVDAAPNKNAVLRTVRQFEFDQTVQLQSVCVDLLNGKKYLLTKGSYDSVSKIVKPDTLPTNASKTLKSLAMEGFYVLAFAYRDLTFDLTGATTTTSSTSPPAPNPNAFLTMPRSDLEREETFLGFVLFRNELKVDSVAAIRELKRGDIKPIMVTGDNIWTGLHIGEEAGLIPRGAVVLAADVEPGRVAPELSWQYVKKEQAEYLPAWIDLLTSGKTLDYHAKLSYYGAEIMNASPPGSIIEEARQSQAAARRGSESSSLSGGTSRAADGAARRRSSADDLSSVRALRLGPVRNFVLSGHRKFPHEKGRWSKDVERPILQFEGPGVEDAGDGYWIAGDGQDHFSKGFTQAASRALSRMKTAEKLRLASCTVVKGRNANTRTTDQTLGSAPSASSLVQLDGDDGAAKKTITEILSELSPRRRILLQNTRSDASKNAPLDADVSANSTEEGRPKMNGDEAAKQLGNLHLEQDPSGPPAFYFALSEAAVNFLQERDPELLARIQRRIAVYGKVSPSGKVQVVRSLQRLNYVVGMCGDGGNDCAALRAAHAGMALSEGDASIVAAFSTPRKSLFGVVELIRQGRCCLRASTSLVELQMVVGAVYAGIVIVHSHNDTYFSDVCKTGAEVFPFACIVTLASALPPLHRGLVDPWGRMLVRRWSSRIFKGRGAEEVNQRFRPSVDGRSLLPGEVEQEVVGGGRANAANVVENEEDSSSDSDDGGAGGQDGNNAGRNARNVDPQRSSSRASPEGRASNADPAKNSRRENWKPRRFRDGRWRMLSRSRTSGNLFERSRVLTLLLLFAFLAAMLGGLMKLLNYQVWFVPYNLYSLNLKNGMGPNPTQLIRFDSGGVPTSHVLNWVFLFSIFTGLVAVSRDGKWRQRVWCNPMVALPVSMLAVFFVWPYYFGNNWWNLVLRINVDNRFSWETSDATAWAFWRFFQVASNEVNSMEYWFSRPEDDDAFYHLPPLALDDQYAGNDSDEDDRASGRAPGSTLLWSGEWRAMWDEAEQQVGLPRAGKEERAEGNTTDANVDHESAEEEEEEEEEEETVPEGVHSNFWYEDHNGSTSGPWSPDSHSPHRYRIEQLKKIMGRDDLGFDRAEPARRFLTELGGLDRALRPLREKLLAHFDAGMAVVEPGDNNSTSNARARVKPKSAFWPSANVELRVYHTNTRQKVLDVSDKAMGADAEEGVAVVPSSHDPVGVAVSLEHLMNDALVTGFAEKSGAGAREKSASSRAAEVDVEVAPQEQGAEVLDRKSDLASFVCQELCAATWSFPDDDPERFPEWFAGDIVRERFYCWYASVSLGWEGNKKTRSETTSTSTAAPPECLLLPRLDSEGRPVGPEHPGYVNRVLVPGGSFFPTQLKASTHTIVLDRDVDGQPRVQHNYLMDDHVRTRHDHQLGGKREHKARHEIEQVNKATSGFLQEDEQNQIFEESPSDDSCAASTDDGLICEGDDSDCDDSRSDPRHVVRGFRGRENSFLSSTSSSRSAESGAVAKPRFSFSPSRTRTRTTEVQAEGYAAKPATGRDGAESMTPRSMRGASSSSVSSFIAFAAARDETSAASESGNITEVATLSRKERLSRARARASQTPAQREERIRTGGLILQKETASTPASARRYRTFYLNRHNFLSWYSLNWRSQIPENSTHSRWLQEKFESAGFSFSELNRPLYYPRADFDPREEFHHWFPHAYAHYPSGFVPSFSLYLAVNTLFISLLTCALFHLFLKVPPLWRFFHGTGS